MKNWHLGTRKNRLRTIAALRGQMRTRFLTRLWLGLEQLESRVLLSGTVNITTYHNNNAATGVNPLETILTPANVNVGSFGKLFTRQVDGQVYAQPLVMTAISIAAGINTSPGATGVHDVVYVATQNDSLYAIDTSTGAILWFRPFSSTINSGGNVNDTLGASSISALSSGDVGSTDITPSIGITGTPVIDAASGLLYVITKTSELVGSTRHYVQRLHAIKLSDGTDASTPYLIGDTTSAGNNTQIWTFGNGDGRITDPYTGSGRQVIQFNALTENQRPALSLVNGTVFAEWASHGDNGPYHGFVVAWDVTHAASTGVTLKGVLNTSPNNGLSGIWQGGGGLVFEPNGSGFYFETGNGSGGAPQLDNLGFPGNSNYNNAIVKATLDPTTSPTHQNNNGWGIKILDYFIPYDVVALDGADSDFGSGAPVLLPDSAGIPGHPHLMVVGGKSGVLYVIDRDNMGHYNANFDNVVNAVPNPSGHTTAPNAVFGLLSTPVWYNNRLYVVSGYNGPAYSFSLNSDGILNGTSQTQNTNFGYLPGTPSLSANGAANGVIWFTDRSGNKIHAYNASSLAIELWNSGMAAGGVDNVGAVNKFASPTIANGQVFVGTTNALVVYGLKAPANAAPLAPSLNTAAALSGTSINLTWTDSTVTPNTATAYLIEMSVNNTSNFTQVATAAAGATSTSIGGLVGSTTYYFRIRGLNPFGTSTYSIIRSATTTAQTAAVDFSGGFGASAPLLMQLNGNSFFSGNQLWLTSNQQNQRSSAWTASQVDVTQFTTQFQFQLNGTWPLGSGITFAIQRDLPTSIGIGGSGLGYGAANVGGNGGIPHSVAVKFAFSTGFYVDGEAPINNSISVAPVSLVSYNPMLCAMTYNGTTLTVYLKDTLTNASATQSYTVNIPALIGGNNAWVGFTGATGAQVSNQVIQNWKYSTNGVSSPSASPNAPTGLGAVPATATSVNLNWTANAANIAGYHLDRATDEAFTQNLVTQNLPASPALFTDTLTGLAPGMTFFYRLRAFNAVGDSGNSNMASAYIPLAPPKPSNQSVTEVTDTTISLLWQDNAGHEADSYNILRSANHGSFSIVATLPPTSRTAPSEYEWTDENLTPGTFYEYHIVAFNTSGYNDFAGANATTLPGQPKSLTATPGTGTVALSWAASAGATTYDVSRATTPGGPYVTVGNDLAVTTFNDSGITSGTTYYYIVTAEGPSGESPDSAEVSATPSSIATTIDFTGGFAGAGSALKLNGSATINSGKLSLTSNLSSQVASAYFTTQQNIAAFSTQFDFQITGSWPLGDGFTFVIQRAGQTALGLSGGGLGYGAAPGGNGSGGIPNSVAIKFDVYGNQSEGTNSTGLYANGAAPAATNSIDLNATGFNLRSYNQLRACMTYNGTTLTVVLRDLLTNATATQTYTVNIPALIGGNTAWVGFTAACGSIVSNETILNWKYISSPGGPVIPAVPTGLGATPGNGQAALSWGAVAGATSYNVKYATVSGGPYGTISGISGTSSTVPGLTNGTPYYFVVSAQNSAGEGGNSSQVSATPVAPLLPPGIPSGLATTPGNGQVALTWNTVAGATTYNLKYGTVNGGPYTTVSGITPGSTTITGLTNGTPYYFVVSAQNAAGEGGNSTQVSATPAAPAPTLPAAPSGLAATPGNAQVALTWSAVVGAGTYNLKYGTTSGGPYTTISGLTGTSTTVPGLVNGTPYYFVVSAQNVAGEGANSTQISAVPVAPAAPVLTLDFASGFGSAASAIQLNGNSAFNGSSLMLTNNLTSQISSAYAKTQQNISAFATQFDYQITGTWPLGDGFTFVIQRAAVTAIGPGGGGLGYGNAPGTSSGGIGNSIAIKFDIFGNQGEGANSTGFYANGATPTITNSISLEGTGFNMRSYNLSRATMTYDGTTLTVTLKDLVTNATATQNYTVNIPALIGGTSAWVGFTAASGALISTQRIANWTFAAAPSAPPAAPAGLGAVPGNASVVLSWGTVSGANSYNVKYATVSGGPYTSITGIASTGTTVPGLSNGVPYYFVVSAVNSAGEGGNSGEISSTPVAPAIPGAPGGLIASPANTQVALSWGAVAGAASYSVKGATTPGGPYTTLASNLSGTSANVTSLTNGTTYYFVVTASNVSGESGNSGEAQATPLAPIIPVPAKVTGVNATPGNGQVAVAWAGVSGATSYSVKYATVSGGPYTTISGLTGTSTTVPALPNGTQYFFVVSATNGGGEGPNSDQVSATPNLSVTTIDFSSGFASAGGGLTYNGTAFVNGSTLQLTQNQTSQVASVYASTQQNITSFTTQFDFQLTGSWPLGEGFTFVIQRAGLNAIGQSGGGLGYGATTTGAGINNSVAIKFDVFSNNGEGANSTGLYANGATPTSANSISLDGTGFNLRSYNLSRVTMAYNGTTLTVTLKDMVTGATATQTYTVNIASLIGGNTAWVGFTASAGSQVANQNILNWTYTA